MKNNFMSPTSAGSSRPQSNIRIRNVKKVSQQTVINAKNNKTIVPKIDGMVLADNRRTPTGLQLNKTLMTYGEESKSNN